MSCAKRYVPKLEFPRREVITLALCSTTLNYTLVNLFPYVGIMVKDMMALDSINEAGNCPSRISGKSKKRRQPLLTFEVPCVADGYFIPLESALKSLQVLLCSPVLFHSPLS